MIEPAKHLDEARNAAIQTMDAVAATEGVKRALLIDDVFGLLRVVIWSDENATVHTRAQAALAVAAPFGSDTVWIAPNSQTDETFVYEAAWEEARAVGTSGRLRILDRRRNRGSWFSRPVGPPWASGGDSPRIASFYSFKGGVGRTTSLAAIATLASFAGERVVVVDLDFDAPGVGTLLASDAEFSTARWGALDFLLETGRGEFDFRDYYHSCLLESVAGPGELLVMPAGRLDMAYVGKLARLDLEPPPDGSAELPLVGLLRRIRTELAPKWILLDVRAGISEAAGYLLRGISHVSVLFGTSSEQSWRGLRLAVENLGAERLRLNQAQADCLVVQSMAPAAQELRSLSSRAFAERSEDEFLQHYYAPDPLDSADERFWYVRDAQDDDAPHVPVVIPYREELAHFRSFGPLAPLLRESSDYRALYERLSARFVEPEP